MPCRGMLLLAALATMVARPALGAEERCLRLDERVGLMERVERFHAERRGPARAVADATRRLSPETLAAKARAMLRKNAALGEVFGEPVTAADLAAEVVRIRSSTRDPRALERLCRLLGDDPFLVAELVARPLVVARRFDGRFRERIGGNPDAFVRDFTPRDPTWLEPALNDPFPPAGPLQIAPRQGFHEEAPDYMADDGVFTGSELIVWGGYGTRSGGAYDAVTDTWRPLASAGSPRARADFACVWTGTEMIVWGGARISGPYLADGGAYDPALDRWRTLPPSPLTARAEASAVWTGTEMILFGGFRPAGGALGDGAAFDPALSTWRTLSASGAPSARYGHVAVWTGGRMFVWGGEASAFLADGALYDPVADVWQATATGLSARGGASAVWTGQEAIVWGGEDAASILRSGGRYDPATDSWTPMVDAPTAKIHHSAVWTGSRMIVWGGRRNGAPSTNTGALYDPLANSWVAISTVNAPSPRRGHAEAWTGTELVVWGGGDGAGWLRSGGRYAPATDTWRGMSTGSAPSPREGHTAVWTGAEMIVWGGEHWSGSGRGYLDTGGRYDPVTDSWQPTSMMWAPEARSEHVAVFTGQEMLVVYGGRGSYELRNGARYDPATDTWRPMGMTGSPGARLRCAAAWTGSELLVWGGEFDWIGLGDGGRYDPVTDAWSPMASTGAPSARNFMTGVWSGTELLIWGGGNTGPVYFNDGARYDPVQDAWTPMAVSPLPGTVYHTAVWTGSEMIVWRPAGDGARYAPASDSWAAVTNVGGPTPRDGHTASFTGSEMVIWGGYDGTDWLQSGGRYDPVADAWRPTAETDGVPAGRSAHSATWTGLDLLVFGGSYGVSLATGGIYDPSLDRWLSRRPPGGSHVLASKGPGPGVANDSRVRAYRVDGTVAPADFLAFPSLSGYGVHPAGRDRSAGGVRGIVAGAGPGPTFPPELRGFDALGLPLGGFAGTAYGAPGYGVRTAGGRIDGSEAIVTGPGPSPVYGPHVRGFRYDNVAVVPLSKVSFYAYGTLRYGVHPVAGDVEADGFEEIVTGAGSGAVFGPHVRAFDYDGQSIRAIGKVNFFAYGTPRFGVEVAGADVDGDGAAEILTGPGPSSAFAAQLRGFDYDGVALRAIPGINAIVLPGAVYGLSVAGGDLEGDGFEEIACGKGPDPGFGARLRAFDYDASSLVEIPPLTLDPYGTPYGLRVGVASLGN